jgi:hypothetical protein
VSTFCFLHVVTYSRNSLHPPRIFITPYCA